MACGSREAASVENGKKRTPIAPIDVFVSHTFIYTYSKILVNFQILHCDLSFPSNAKEPIVKSKLKFITLALKVLNTAARAIVPKNEIVTEALLPAKPEQVWQVLTDGAQYSDWNPFIVKVEGRFEKGERLTNTMKPQINKQMVFTPEVIEVKVNEELRWVGRVAIPGIFDGEHYFILESHEGQTRFTHGEKFSGFALWFINTDQYLENFKAMNIALSNRLKVLTKKDASKCHT